MKRHPDVRVRSSELVFRGRAFDVVRERVLLPSGLEQDLAIVDHPGAVGIVPITAEGRVVLVRQYRHAIGDWLVEIPAGRLEPGEQPAQAAARELEEETGFRATRWTELGGFFAAPGFCSEWMRLFAASGLVEVVAERAAMDADEEFELLQLPFEEALRAVEPDAKSWIALRRWQALSADR
ncbi:MAG: NUDIX hydrolase [Planctomycetes bacterium]|nr:NUDIX hydrolase [Planctomycetota bacterium]